MHGHALRDLEFEVVGGGFAGDRVNAALAPDLPHGRVVDGGNYAVHAGYLFDFVKRYGIVVAVPPESHTHIHLLSSTSLRALWQHKSFATFTAYFSATSGVTPAKNSQSIFLK